MMVRTVFMVVMTSVLSCSTTPEVDARGDYQDQDTRFRIGDPGAGWQPVSVPTANAAWVREDSSTLLVNSQCDKTDAPLSALSGELLFGTTERVVLEQRVIPMDGREAMETVAEAKLDGVLRKRQMLVLKKDGCVYDFVLDAPLDVFGDALTGYQGVVSGFATSARP
jgi:hypothetical protein